MMLVVMSAVAPKVKQKISILVYKSVFSKFEERELVPLNLIKCGHITEFLDSEYQGLKSWLSRH